MKAHLHILGICGTFMGGIAALAKAAGWRVTGCDSSVYPPMSDQLSALGVDIVDGFDPSQLDLAPDLWVIGNVVSRGNPLMEAILDRGDRYCSGPQWLAEHILLEKWVLAVSGTHGKTTVSAMLAWILESAGLSPGFLIGGVPGNFGVSARWTKSPHFVVEADEYDTAFFDKRSKFVHYRPRTLVLNNLEFDHADIFDNLADIERQFHHLVRTVPASGKIVAGAGDQALERVLAKGCWTPIEQFGEGGEWRAGAADPDGSFDVMWRGKSAGKVRWGLIGDHNRSNALAAIAAARHAGVEPSRAVAALGTFAGVKRRMELRGKARGVAVYDDFAHHPTAIRLTVEGLRKRIGQARILAVLEPRSNTMKLGAMKSALPGSLENCDRVFLHAAGLSWDAAEALRPLGDRATCYGSVEAIVAAVGAEARPGDHVLVMSNGGFGGIHGKLLARLGQGSAS